MFKCKYCGKECKKFGLKNHETYCNANPNKKSRKGKNNPSFGKKGGNQYTAHNDFELSDDTRKKLSEKSTIHNKEYWTNENKKRQSELMKEVVKRHPESYSAANINGRVKKVEYKGYKLDGGWELIVAKWLDEKNIKWEKNIHGFEYEWKGKRTYYPDFFLPDMNLYIEVKGYERPVDKVKWAAVSNLVVLKHKEIKLIKKNKYSL